jgi:hypothetical protein
MQPGGDDDSPLNILNRGLMRFWIHNVGIGIEASLQGKFAPTSDDLVCLLRRGEQTLGRSHTRKRGLKRPPETKNEV